MNEFQILVRLNELSKDISLAVAMEVMGQVVLTREVLEGEGHSFDESTLIRDTLDYALEEL